jgi:hypothetical protein
MGDGVAQVRTGRRLFPPGSSFVQTPLGSKTQTTPRSKSGRSQEFRSWRMADPNALENGQAFLAVC